MKTKSLLLLVAAAAGAAGLVWYFKPSANAAPATGTPDLSGSPSGAATASGTASGLLGSLMGLLGGNTATGTTTGTLTSSLAGGVTSPGTQTTSPGASVSPPPGPPAYDHYKVEQLHHGTLVTYFAYDSKGKKSTIGTAFRPAPQGETKAQRAARLKIKTAPAGTLRSNAAPATTSSPTTTPGVLYTTSYYGSPSPPVSTLGQPSNVGLKHTRPGGI